MTFLEFSACNLEFLDSSLLSLIIIILKILKKANYHIIGAMSGTSLDGIDLAEIVFEISSISGISAPLNAQNGSLSGAEGKKWSFKILAAETVPYTIFWKDTLREAIDFTKEKLERLDFKYTEKLSGEISRFIKKH